MRHFYGYQRQSTDAPEGADRVWLDCPESERQERADMMLALRPGDVVVVVAAGDLGAGREIAALRADIAARGCTVEVVAPEREPGRIGRPRLFDPSPEQSAKIARLYRGHQTLSYVLDRASEIMGQPVERHHLRRKFGNRWPGKS